MHATIESVRFANIGDNFGTVIESNLTNSFASSKVTVCQPENWGYNYSIKCKCRECRWVDHRVKFGK